MLVALRQQLADRRQSGRLADEPVTWSRYTVGAPIGPERYTARMTAEPSRFALTYDQLKAWCARQGYRVRANDQAGQIAIEYALLGQNAPLLLLPLVERGMVMLVMRLPFMVPASRVDAMVDACNRLNVTSFMGAWALNRTTGELFFRATVPSLDNAYSDAGFLHAARVVVGTAERAAPALKTIALDGAAPDVALAALTSPGVADQA